MAVAFPDSPALDTSAPTSLAEAQARWRQSAAYRARPRPLEQAIGLLTLFFLTAGLPTEWFVILQAADSATITGGSLVIVVFTGLIGTLLIFSMKRPKAMFYLLVCELALILFSLLILTSPLWSVDFNQSFRRAVALTLTTLLGIYFTARYSLEQLLNRLSIVFFATMLLNVVWVNVLPQYGMNFDQFIGITVNRNSLGQQAVLGCLIMVFAFRSKNHRIIAVIGFVGSLYLVIGTKSKTSLASLLLLGALLVVFSTFRARKQLFGAVIVSEVTAGVFGLLFATANLAFITDLLDRDITLTGRTVLWENLLVPIGERPVLGYGWEAFWGGWNSPAHEIWVQNNWLPPTAHNAPLEYLLTIGIVGLTVWAFMMARGLWRSIHYLRDRPGIAGLFPIAMISYAILYSVTEAGVVRRGVDWMLLVVALVETKRFMDRNRSSLDGSRAQLKRHSMVRGRAGASAIASPADEPI